MSRDEVQKLLGGYATGTLTPDERAALFEAALDDQDLFDQLAKEQPLQELLSDASVRAQLLTALEATPEPWYRRWAAWGLPALATAALVAGVAVWRLNQNHARPTEVAQIERPAATSVAPAPASQPDVPAPKPPMASLAEGDAVRAQARRQSPSDELKTKAAPEPQPEIRAKDERAASTFGAVAGGARGGVIGGVPGSAPPAPPPPPPATAPMPATAPTNAPLPVLQASPQALSRFAPAAPPAQKALSADAAATRGLTGTVRDATGAPISGADVRVFASGDDKAPLADAKTGAAGQFSAPVGSGSYRVEVSANGFQSYRRDSVQVDAEGQNPLGVTLQVGSVAETVTVASGAQVLDTQPSQQGQSRPSNLLQLQGAQPGALMDRATLSAGIAGARASASVKILRQQPGGKPAEAQADNLHVGDNLVIEITPAATGFLTLMESGTTLVNRTRVEAGKPFDVPSIALTAAGVRQFTAFLDVVAATGGGGGGGRGGAVRGDLAKKKEADSNAAFTAAPISIRITVK